MTDKKAIERLKEIIKYCHGNKECWENEFCPDCYIDVEDVFAIETILNELDKKNKEIEELKKNQCNHNIDNGCIPKSKIQEKIDKLREIKVEGEVSTIAVNFAKMKLLEQLKGEDE